MDIFQIINIIISSITLLCAILGGIFGYYKFKKSFEQINTKILSQTQIEEANHRQKWVDDFRNELANYFNIISLILREDNVGNENIEQLGCAHYNILLRLNPNDEIDKKLKEDERKFFENIKIIYNHLNKHSSKYQNNNLLVNEYIYDDIKKSEEFSNYQAASEYYDDCIGYYVDDDGNKHETLNGGEFVIAQLDEAYTKLIPVIINCLQKERDRLVYAFRDYLKVEWERIKELIRNDTKNNIDIKGE